MPIPPIDFIVNNGYTARAIDYSIFTQANTLEELELNIAEAITCHFDGPIFPKFKLIFA
ncbi:2-oxoisovalerate dehydrogenase [Mucilaginibacter sp. ZT4R22]|uniref:2-oxoisovalerate dehydrogenase n=1 Tax=Mucilaginibacter pankratovii TaxID=2772110 RepID=A0ABR7WSK9_9SPHI|nr:2-oxoisovalerate dehydrogenase [Mucilaginibacter pankratovii]MBD1365280.1 2-oxoisovalerate dehydrogenase [Mucilaginibacter pankratovii]